jgi:sugar (pentulose or hexulose) kinase
VSERAYVGLDLGSSSLKGVALAADGTILARAQASYPTARPEHGRAEQDPHDWIAATVAVVTELAAAVPSERWEAIGLAGMVPTLVLADAEGEPIGPAITWQDDRAQAEGDAFRAEHGADPLYARTGQWVDGRYLLPMFRWVRRAEPDRAGRTVRLLGAKDHLFGWLTGEVATDPSTATGFGCFDLGTRVWASELAGAEVSLLPEVRPSTSTAPLAAGAARELGLREGMPVCLGAADSVAGALGLGVREPGDCAYLAGTSTVVLGVSERLVTDPAHRFLVTPLALGESWGLEMDLVSTGSAIAWAATLLGLGGEEAEVLELAVRSEPGARGLVFLPYLGHGEQGALWDPDLRGAIVGLSLVHGREDVARALVEGVVLESRRCVEVLDAAGVAPAEIRAAGGAFASGLFPELLAGATARPVLLPEDGAASARGAALLAAAAVGDAEVPALAASAALARVDPDPAVAPLWADLWERHERARATVATPSGEA